MRILFTGGSGKAGRHAIACLQAEGHVVVNLDRQPLPGVETRIADITDAGQVLDIMAGYAGFDDLEDGRRGFDAVVHFAAIPRILLMADAECYRVNVMGTYNVLDAALKLGIRNIVFASSETTYGICFARGERRPDYLPVDEDHPVLPEDSYAMSKVINEVTARSLQLRSGADIYGFRINNVIEPQDYAALVPRWLADPASRRRNIFAYIDARDLGQAVACALTTDGLGFQIFNIANDDLSVGLDSAELARRFYDGVPMAEMAPRQSFYSNAKARRLLGFAPRHSWRDHLGGAAG